MTDEDILKGARAFARDLNLPGGRPGKPAKIIARHLGWFAAARERGLEWDDIVAVLFAAGAKRANGQPLSRGHLSSLVWRKTTSSAAKPQRLNARLETADRVRSGHRGGDPTRSKRPSGRRNARSGGASQGACTSDVEPAEGRSPPAVEQHASVPTQSKDAFVQPAAVHEEVANSAQGQDGKADVLRFMKRAARARRSDDGA